MLHAAAVERLKSSRPHSVTNLTFHTDQGVQSHAYCGIHKAWQLRQLHPGREDVIFCFHSKGITHCNNYSSFEKECRIEPEARATINLIQSRASLREVYDRFPAVAMHGLSGIITGMLGDHTLTKPMNHFLRQRILSLCSMDRSVQGDSHVCHSTFHTRILVPRYVEVFF